MSTPIYTQPSYSNTSFGNITLKMPGTMGSAVVITGTGGSGGISYSTSHNTWAASDIKPNSINVNGDAVFNGNIQWQGRDMREWFAAVESRLSILQPNPKLEDEYEKLKELGNQYRALEKQLLEQQHIFNILKKPLE